VDPVTLLSGLIILAGLAGIVVPVLPGLVLVLAGVAVWALARHDTTAWIALAVACVLTLAGVVAKYLLPGRRLRESGVPWSTIALGTALGVVGFFVIPVVGLFAGFVLGVYLAERTRLGEHARAWPSTLAALKAVGWSMAIELLTGLLVAATWAAAVRSG
jgi:uncharacterized protein